MLPSRFADTVDELESIINEYEKTTSIASILVLIADKNQPSKAVLDSILQACSITVIGGIFAEVIYQGIRKIEGIVVIPLLFEIQAKVIDLSNSEAQIMSQLASDFTISTKQNNHFFLFIDAFANGKEKFMDCFYNSFGNSVTVLGAGAGSMSFNQTPCIISNRGVEQNVVVIGYSKINATIGVSHGWKPISRPLKITESDDTKLISLDWRPAFEVYKEIVEEHSAALITEENFFEIAKSYPIGMVKLDAEHVVRDPYKVEKNIIYNLDRVEQGQYISIMNGTEETLIEAAQKVREFIDEKLNFSSAANHAFFCIDCISRVMSLQENFATELQVLAGDTTVNGALTLGEIGNNGETFLEIYNKTVVLAKWEIIT